MNLLKWWLLVGWIHSLFLNSQSDADFTTSILERPNVSRPETLGWDNVHPFFTIYFSFHQALLVLLAGPQASKSEAAFITIARVDTGCDHTCLQVIRERLTENKNTHHSIRDRTQTTNIIIK